MVDFEGVHERLKGIIRRHADGLVVTRDGPAGMAIEVPGLEGGRGAMSPARASARAASAST